jgi:transporter family-2 protein
MNLGPWIAMFAVVLAGGATALQAPTNARLAAAVSGPVNAAFVSFAVGTAALGIVAMLMQARPDMAAVKGLPPYAWIGGLYGAVFVVAAAWAVPRLGVAMTITGGSAINGVRTPNRAPMASLPPCTPRASPSV